MAYLTEPLATARVGGSDLWRELTDDDGDGTPDANVKVLLLGQVDSLLDGYAARAGYTIPLAATDVALLMPALLDVSNYKAKTRRGRASKEDLENYKNALALFKMLADGDFVLPSASAGDTGAFANLNFDGYEQQYNRDTLRNL